MLVITGDLLKHGQLKIYPTTGVRVDFVISRILYRQTSHQKGEKPLKWENLI